VDWKQILEIASPITIIFAAGMIAQQIKTLREETSEFRTILREWRAVLVRLGSVEEFTRKNTSDIRDLLEKHHKTREEMISHHSLEDI
jgi:predicted  nucleic acid-binding Zn-ribbon protein